MNLRIRLKGISGEAFVRKLRPGTVVKRLKDTLRSNIQKIRGVCDLHASGDFSMVPAYAGIPHYNPIQIQINRPNDTVCMETGSGSGGVDMEFIRRQDRLGKSYLVQRAYDKAIACFRSILDIKPTDVRAKDGLARAYAQKGDHETAKRLFEELLAINPNDYRAKYGLAKSLEAMGETEEAKILLKEVLQIEPSDARSLDELGMISFHERDFTMARYYYYEILNRINSKDVPALNQLGEIAYIEEDFPLAKKYFMEILEQRPTDHKARNGLGKVAWSEGQYDLAESIFKDILSENSRDIQALHGLGRVYLSKGMFSQADHYFKTILGLQPGDSFAINWLGRVSMAMRNFQQAISYFRQIKKTTVVENMNFTGYNLTQKIITKCGNYHILLIDLKTALESRSFIAINTGDFIYIYLILDSSLYELHADPRTKTLITISKICGTLPPQIRHLSA